MGTISKTVYNPAAIKAKAKTELASPTAVGAADFVSRMEAVKQHEIIKKVGYHYDSFMHSNIFFT